MAALLAGTGFSLQAGNHDFHPEGNESVQSEKRQAALKIQLFLDSNGFGPGRIDAYWGQFTRKATTRWNASNSGQAIPLTQSGDPDLSKISQIPWNKPLVTKYTITSADEKKLGNVPEQPAAKADQSSLPYETLLELVAEKFHAYPDFICELNPQVDPSSLSAGTTLTVPNVAEPFDLSAVKNASSAGESAGEITVLSRDKMLEFRKDGKLVHTFPITPGAEGNQAPPGNWKVDTVAFMPTFRYDEKMLEEGKRSENAHIFPPGPNNPVGIVWIGINSEGIGIHGTSNPDDIGRNASHGCIRLANWDAAKLAPLVGVGTPVVIR
ncbi:MAG: L,D-transpeptidase [Verrucomicrobiales bacterium]|nr:L,D-transpeptidase [Verrucomicrobiales bacterium]